MSLLTNVFRRGGSFYFRAAVPKPLWALVGRRELWRSLRTADPAVARRRGILMLGLTEQLWRDLQPQMSAEEIKLLIAAWTKAQLDADSDARRELSSVALAQYDEAQRDVFSDAVLRRSEEYFDSSIARKHVTDLLAERGLTLDARDTDIAVRLMMGAHVHVFKAITLRREKRWRPFLEEDPARAIAAFIEQSMGEIKLEAPRPVTQTQKVGKLSEVAKAAITDLKRTRSWPPKRVADHEHAVEMLIFALGRDPDMTDVTPNVAGRYMRDLTRYPAHATKRQPYRDLDSFKDRIDAAERRKGEVLGAVTINNKYLGPLGQIWAWKQPECRDLVNPFKELRAEAPRHAASSNARRDFEPDEVVRFFAQPLFTGSASSSQAGLYQPGPIKVDDWRFWIPLICFFSGMRLNEACGLAVADIRRADDVDFFHVRDEVEGQSLKSAAARRKVPIHDQLIEVGFLRFVERQRTAGRTRLFEDLKQDAQGYFSGPPSKFFARLIDRIESKAPEEPGKLVFHSTRHTVTTKLRAAQVRIDFAKEIVGHEQGEVHGGYGSFPLKAVRDAVNKIEYDGLNIAKARRP